MKVVEPEPVANRGRVGEVIFLDYAQDAQKIVKNSMLDFISGR